MASPTCGGVAGKLAQQQVGACYKAWCSFGLNAGWLLSLDGSTSIVRRPGTAKLPALNPHVPMR